MAEANVSVERLREAFAYDPTTGVLTWLISRRGQARPGDVAGCVNHGYRVTKIDQQVLMVHRVAWALTHGRWPAADIDHIDGDPSNNRLSNLREATRGQNMQNRRGAQRNSRSGVIGVWKAKKDLSKPWKAVIVVDRRAQHLGYFASKEEASSAYLAAKKAVHPFQTFVN